MEIWNNFTGLIPHALTKALDDIYSNGKKVRPVLEFSHLPEGARSLFVVHLFQSLGNKKLVILFNDNPNAERFQLELQSLIPENEIAYFPDWDIIPYSNSTPDSEIVRERINTLYQILNNERKIYLISLAGLARRIVSPEILRKQGLSFTKGQSISRRELVEKFISLQYHREEMVESIGHFALRGDIIDIFPSSSENPIRMEFFDDEIERISEFDPRSQRSLNEIENFLLLPKSEILIHEAEQKKFSDWIEECISKKDLDADAVWEHFNRLHRISNESGFEDYLPVFNETIPFPSLFDKDTLFLLPKTEELEEKLDQFYEDFQSLYEGHCDSFPCLPPDKLLIKKEDLWASLQPRIELPLLSRGNAEKMLLQSEIKSLHKFNGKLQVLKEFIREKSNEKYKIWISSPFAAQLHRLHDLLSDFPAKMINIDEQKDQIDANMAASKFGSSQKVPAKKQIKSKAKKVGAPSPLLHFFKSDLHEGFILEEPRQILITDFDIFGRRYRRRSKYKSKRSDPIKSFLDIKPGDYVVHINHGIGQFQGLKRIQAGGKERDFLVLTYANEDILYVPLDQISLVQRYIGSGEKDVRLDQLGGTAWQKAKSRVKANIEALAKELIQIYAARAKLKGFSFSEDTIWQEEFESLFPYEETPDQLEAIINVKRDMESDRPMDRLICGDVGFGKTEVAIRSAFKAVMSGKQVAFLVPTTVLCSQHYKTLSSRFENYPITIKMVSRFVPATETNAIVKGAENGDVEIVVGTHALLNSQFKFKNLGLVIIDEEQRFGVKHKEKLKQYRTLVDVLTMSATPIPRTLHMSLASMRDISVINTPPSGRKAVETFIMEENPDILKMAIHKELERGGQVFYIHNRVETIDFAASMIQELAPQAIIAVAHGQLPKTELENVMLDFVEQRIHILVSTTIVESGLDIPNVNTLIVNRADTFGLSQLYQLKGRVGRSGRKAYAYFFYPADRSLSEIAQKRLQVIHEYSDLGSGFMVAMRDLEIRGAGNILGPQQSGDIIDVGFELYIKLLDEAVQELKGEEVELVEKPAISIKTDFFIPDEYIPDTKQKMEIYKRLEAAISLGELEETIRECEDRFGKPNPIMHILFTNEQIRVLSTLMKIESIVESKDGFQIKPGKNVRIDPLAIIKLLEKNSGASLKGKNNELLQIPFPKGPLEEQKRINLLKNVLQDLYNFSNFSKTH